MYGKGKFTVQIHNVITVRSVLLRLYCSVTQLCPTLRPHGLQHIRLPCSSLSPRVYSNTCPLSWWCHLTISSSAILFSFAFCLSQHRGLFQWVSSLDQAPKVLELQLQHQSFQWILMIDFLSHWLVWSPCSPRDSQESSPAPQFKSVNSLVLNLLYGPTLTTSTHNYWKKQSFDYTDLGKGMSLFFNTLSRFVIAFLPRASVF